MTTIALDAAAAGIGVDEPTGAGIGSDPVNDLFVSLHQRSNHARVFDISGAFLGSSIVPGTLPTRLSTGYDNGLLFVPRGSTCDGYQIFGASAVPEPAMAALLMRDLAGAVLGRRRSGKCATARVGRSRGAGDDREARRAVLIGGVRPASIIACPVFTTARLILVNAGRCRPSRTGSGAKGGVEMRHFFAALAFSIATPAFAQGITTYATGDRFEDAAFAVENAIVGRGLVIDHVSHVGEMLDRTGADVGSDRKVFEAANVFVFCSAVLSRKVMEADPMNVAYCPYGIFVADTGGTVVIGYRNLPDGPMQEVQALLDSLAREAAGK